MNVCELDKLNKFIFQLVLSMMTMAFVVYPFYKGMTPFLAEVSSSVLNFLAVGVFVAWTMRAEDPKVSDDYTLMHKLSVYCFTFLGILTEFDILVAFVKVIRGI